MELPPVTEGLTSSFILARIPVPPWMAKTRRFGRFDAEISSIDATFRLTLLIYLPHTVRGEFAWVSLQVVSS